MTATHPHPASHLVQDFIEDDATDPAMLATWPERIYLQAGDDGPQNYDGDERTWCVDMIGPHDIKYVRADKMPQPIATLTFTQQLALDERQHFIESVSTLEYQLAESLKKATMYEHVRTLTPVDFGCIWRRNVNGFGRFDDLILADMGKRKASK